MATDKELIQALVPMLEMIVKDKQQIGDISKLLALKLPNLEESERAQLQAGGEILTDDMQQLSTLINSLKSQI